MSAKKEGLERIVKGVAKVVDDWGWKGGKPGELTGGAYHRRLDNLYNEYKSGLIGHDEWRALEDDMIDDMYPIIENQVRKSKNLDLRKAFEKSGSDVDTFTLDMKELEDAGIPREWTGKVYAALSNSMLNKRFATRRVHDVQKISDLMRPMTNEQREVFLSLIPRWQGSFETAATAAKKLYRR